MDFKEHEYKNGTLLVVSFEGGELGMFVGHPENADDVKTHDPETVLVGSPLDIVVRKTPAAAWDAAPDELCEGITKLLAGMEKKLETEPIGRNEGAADGMWTADAMHRMILAFMKRALTTFFEKRLN